MIRRAFEFAIRIHRVDNYLTFRLHRLQVLILPAYCSLPKIVSNAASLCLLLRVPWRLRCLGCVCWLCL